MNDLELLQDYVRTRSDAAFAELVRRHVDLVYSTAWRRAGESQMAQDIAQAVFIRLARKAASVRDGNALAGWLYRATCYEAASALRSEQRRRQRETEAMNRAELDTDAAPTWAAIQPVLDEAMQGLSRLDQDAVVLRFFEDKSLAEVGRLLGLTEEAARKRVSRALERLRAKFERQGVKVASAALASALAGHAIQAAPAGLAAALVTTSVTAGTAGAGLFSTFIATLLMKKTAATILALVAVGAIVTPLALRQRPTPKPEPTVPSPGPRRVAVAQEEAAAQGTVIQSPAPTPRTSPPLLARVAALPPLTPAQIEAYVAQNRSNAESLLAAYRIGTNLAYLTEAATRFPGDVDVQYAVLANGAFPETHRQWIEAYKQTAPDNALAWYFSALDHFKAGETAQAIQDLVEATGKPAYRAELAPTLQAVEELNLSAGRAADEAKVAAFQACAQVPHLTQMRDLAKAMQAAAQQYRQQSDTASVESLAGMGLILGGHLSAGGGSQTVINQLVGIAIEKMFLRQLDPRGQDSFGRPVAEVSAAITQHQATLKDFAQTMSGLTAQLSDAEWANYLERVKLYGEESALTWLKAKHESP